MRFLQGVNWSPCGVFWHLWFHCESLQWHFHATFYIRADTGHQTVFCTPAQNCFLTVQAVRHRHGCLFPFLRNWRMDRSYWSLYALFLSPLLLFPAFFPTVLSLPAILFSAHMCGRFQSLQAPWPAVLHSGQSLPATALTLLCGPEYPAPCHRAFAPSHCVYPEPLRFGFPVPGLLLLGYAPAPATAWYRCLPSYPQFHVLTVLPASDIHSVVSVLLPSAQYAQTSDSANVPIHWQAVKLQLPAAKQSAVPPTPPSLPRAYGSVPWIPCDQLSGNGNLSGADAGTYNYCKNSSLLWHRLSHREVLPQNHILQCDRDNASDTNPHNPDRSPHNRIMCLPAPLADPAQSPLYPTNRQLHTLLFSYCGKSLPLQVHTAVPRQDCTCCDPYGLRLHFSTHHP